MTAIPTALTPVDAPRASVRFGAPVARTSAAIEVVRNGFGERWQAANGTRERANRKAPTRLPVPSQGVDPLQERGDGFGVETGNAGRKRALAERDDVGPGFERDRVRGEEPGD